MMGIPLVLWGHTYIEASILISIFQFNIKYAFNLSEDVFSYLSWTIATLWSLKLFIVPQATAAILN